MARPGRVQSLRFYWRVVSRAIGVMESTFSMVFHVLPKKVSVVLLIEQVN